MYRIQQFAKLAGVTVRTLHHYDRLGACSHPTARSESGYRLYRSEDLVQLERIVVLRYLGLSLRQIAELLPCPNSKAAPGRHIGHANLAETLATQVLILRERRDGMARVLRAVEAASRSLDATQAADWNLFRTILQEISMQTASEWTKKYYSDEARKAIDNHPTPWTPELQAKFTADWQTMYADVQSALDRNVEPKSPEGQALAQRWMALVNRFTQGNAEVFKGLETMYGDYANWTEEQKQKYAPRPELMAFIRAVYAK